MTKKSIEIISTPESIFLASLFKRLFFAKSKNRMRTPSKNKIARFSSDIYHMYKQRITVNNAEMYIRRARLMLKNVMPFFSETSCTEEMLDEILKKMACTELYMYEIYKTGQYVYPDVFDMFEDEKTAAKLVNNTVLDLYRTVFLRRIAKEQIEKLIPDNPKDEYPETRKMKRQFIIHIGLTNTGKTYSALEALKAAKKGAYLSPLRLLALEVQERLIDDNVPCSMLTGEEEDIIEGADHIASTVEKANYSEHYDVVVIDECQLIQDEDRGCWWTKAILGMKGAEMHLCCAPEAKDILVTIVEDCKDKYKIVEHTRNTDLVFSKKPFRLEKAERGDALVVFSRKSVLRVADELYRSGKKASMIYGALPYKTRKEQLKMFLEGKTDVVVATDAIGMGLNLPIRRIVFLETEKYDGTQTRMLVPWEVKQIAGRAGRQGMYEKGYVSTVSDPEIIQQSLDTPNSRIEYAYLGFSDVLLDIDCDIVDALKIWKSMPTGSFYVKQDVTRTINLCELVKKIHDSFTKKEMLRLSSIPFDEGNETVLELFKDYTLLYSYKEEIFKPSLKGYSLIALEDYYKCLDLYYSFAKNMGYKPDFVWLKDKKLEIADRINRELMDHSSLKRVKCSICGRPLNKYDRNGICRICENDNNLIELAVNKN
ncbi:MAG: helicase-related protein [Clostridia bacterium]